MNEHGSSPLAGEAWAWASREHLLWLLTGKLLTSGQSGPGQARSPRSLACTPPNLAAPFVIHGLSQWALCSESQKRQEF